MSRCNSFEDQKIGENIGSQANDVYHWPCTKEILGAVSSC
jgi:hypothetical protein